METTLAKRLVDLATHEPNKPAFVFVDKNWKRTMFSRQDLKDLGRKFAAILRKRGINRGDVVCNTLPNSPERLITQLGTLMAGAIDMNGQICLADGADFIHSLNQGRSKAVILDPADAEGAARILNPRVNKNSATSGTAFCSDVPSLQIIISFNLRGDETSEEELTLQDIIEETHQEFIDTEPDDECSYMCTSGSTGFFKLVSFTSKSIIEFGRIFGGGLGISEESIDCNDRPLGWLGGYPSVYFAWGCTRVMIDCTNGRPENYAQFLWEVIDREKCTVAYSVPLLLETLTQEAARNPHESGHLLSTCGCGGGPLTVRHMEAIGKVSEKIVAVYASTEGGIMATWTIEDPKKYESLSSGWPTEGTEIKIVNKNLEQLPTGQEGEVLFRTTQSASKYVNDDTATNETFLPHGWIRLGDIGIINKEGRVTVVGRHKFAILRGPLVVYPDQLELRIKQCPGIEDVVVTGVPDKQLYEEVCALVIPEAGTDITENTVREFCERTLFLSQKKSEMNPMPKYFEFVDSFPTLVSGKLDRSGVKQMARNLLKL